MKYIINLCFSKGIHTFSDRSEYSTRDVSLCINFPKPSSSKDPTPSNTTKISKNLLAPCMLCGTVLQRNHSRHTDCKAQAKTNPNSSPKMCI